MRDALRPEWLSGTDDTDYHPLEREYRRSLFFLLDDGWDVPEGTENRGRDSTRGFGSLDPDPGRFSCYGTSPVERLARLNELCLTWSYAGLGLWVSPQIPYEEKDVGEGKIRSYWEERAKWCNEAGVRYWKVDWGLHERDFAYRRIMTESV